MQFRRPVSLESEECRDRPGSCHVPGGASVELRPRAREKAPGPTGDDLRASAAAERGLDSTREDWVRRVRRVPRERLEAARVCLRPGWSLPCGSIPRPAGEESDARVSSKTHASRSPNAFCATITRKSFIASNSIPPRSSYAPAVEAFGELKVVCNGKAWVLERRRRLASGKRRPEVCSSSVTDSRGVPLLRPEYAAGFRVDAAVLRSRPSMVNENGETRRENRYLGMQGK